jgi:hypothetical protein
MERRTRGGAARASSQAAGTQSHSLVRPEARSGPRRAVAAGGQLGTSTRFPSAMDALRQSSRGPAGGRMGSPLDARHRARNRYPLPDKLDAKAVRDILHAIRSDLEAKGYTTRGRLAGSAEA